MSETQPSLSTAVIRAEARHLAQATEALALELPEAVFRDYAPMARIAVIDKEALAELIDAVEVRPEDNCAEDVLDRVRKMVEAFREG